MKGLLHLGIIVCFFAISFLVGFQLVKRMYVNEEAAPEWMDKLLVYAVVGTIVGARLGHVFFYDWEYYSKNLIEIPMVWKGGLASHGAAIALIIAMWIFSKKITKKHTLWSLDKLVIAVALASGFIRLGNLMNSEIVGNKTESSLSIFYQEKSESDIIYNLNYSLAISPWFRNLPEVESLEKNTTFKYEIGTLEYGDEYYSFLRNSLKDLGLEIKINDLAIEHLNRDTIIEGFVYPIADLRIKFPENSPNLEFGEDFEHFSILKLNNYNKEFNQKKYLIKIVPRIPSQLYEALSYWLIFLILFWGYWKQKWYLYEGRLFGAFLVLHFASRFVVEFFKEHQTLADSSALTMGQYLSIPLVLVGVYFWFKSKRIDTN